MGILEQIKANGSIFPQPAYNRFGTFSPCRFPWGRRGLYRFIYIFIKSLFCAKLCLFERS